MEIAEETDISMDRMLLGSLAFSWTDSDSHLSCSQLFNNSLREPRDEDGLRRLLAGARSESTPSKTRLRHFDLSCGGALLARLRALGG